MEVGNDNELICVESSLDGSIEEAKNNKSIVFEPEDCEEEEILIKDNDKFVLDKDIRKTILSQIFN